MKKSIFERSVTREEKEVDGLTKTRRLVDAIENTWPEKAKLDLSWALRRLAGGPGDVAGEAPLATALSRAEESRLPRADSGRWQSEEGFQDKAGQVFTDLGNEIRREVDLIARCHGVEVPEVDSKV